ncbi:hypothetical protein DL96DRAFT_1818002 [Flagelloscypha sp. PMI_526]|nr:hypothetical protein DL96DRAFT_1818002 [Flagelloscypha sp. PMI_526]
MSSNDSPASQPDITEFESVLSNPELYNIQTTNAANSASNLGHAAAQDIDSGSQNRHVSLSTPSASFKVNEPRRLTTLTTPNSPTSLPNDLWQNHLLEVLGKIREEPAAEKKKSKSDRVLAESSKEKVISVHLPEEVRQEEARRLFGVLYNTDSVKSTCTDTNSLNTILYAERIAGGNTYTSPTTTTFDRPTSPASSMSSHESHSSLPATPRGSVDSPPL